MIGTKADKVKRVVFITSFIILPVINFLVFYVYVNFNSFLMAFQKTTNTGDIIWTMDTMKNLIHRIFPLDAEFTEAFRNTLLTFAVQEIMFVIGIFVSYFLYKKILFHQAFRVIFYLPALLPGLVIVSVYKQFIGVDGPIASLVQRLFDLEYIPEFLAEKEWANKFVLLHFIWVSFPGNLIIWGGTFSRIPTSVIESAQLDGVNWVQELFKIILPIVWPTFMLMLILAISGIFGSSGSVFLLTNGTQGTQTISNWMYLQVYGVTISRSNTFNQMSAFGLILTIVSITIALTVRKITSKFYGEVEY